MDIIFKHSAITFTVRYEEHYCFKKLHKFQSLLKT